MSSLSLSTKTSALGNLESRRTVIAKIPLVFVQLDRAFMAMLDVFQMPAIPQGLVAIAEISDLSGLGIAVLHGVGKGLVFGFLQILFKSNADKGFGLLKNVLRGWRRGLADAIQRGEEGGFRKGAHSETSPSTSSRRTRILPSCTESTSSSRN